VSRTAFTLLVLRFVGHPADDETPSGPTMMQKLKERVSDYGNYLKGKESSVKEDPHPELAYIPPGDGKGEPAADLQQGKQHGGVPTATLGKDVPAEATRDYVKNDKSGGTVAYSIEGNSCFSLL